MKKNLITFLILLLTANAHAVPSNTMSITPTATAGSTITAADENTRNNEISGKYNAHSHTDIGQVNNTLNLGDGNSGNKVIQANNTDLNKPSIYWDDTNNLWVATRDGSTVQTILVMTGVQQTKSIFPQSPSDNQHLQYDALTSLWLNSNDVDINSGTIDGVTIGASSAPTVTNLGSVATADINGGTIDGTTVGASSATTGKFTTVTGNSIHLNETTAPTTAASQGALYTKDTSGQPELFFREESSGDEIQLTSAGKIRSQIRLISTTSISAATNSGNISVDQGKFYRVYITLTGANGATLGIRFNSDSTSTRYDWYKETRTFQTSPTVTPTGDDDDSEIELGSFGSESNIFSLAFDLETKSDKAILYGNGVLDQDIPTKMIDFAGLYNQAPTDFELFSSGNMTGTIYVYELGQ